MNQCFNFSSGPGHFCPEHSVVRSHRLALQTRPQNFCSDTKSLQQLCVIGNLTSRSPRVCEHFFGTATSHHAVQCISEMSIHLTLIAESLQLLPFQPQQQRSADLSA